MLCGKLGLSKKAGARTTAFFDPFQAFGDNISTQTNVRCYVLQGPSMAWPTGTGMMDGLMKRSYQTCIFVRSVRLRAATM
jgi:hypothetical protein